MKQDAQYPDPAVVASDVYKLILENDRVRLFNVEFKPGQKAVMHRHPDHVVYVLKGGTNHLAFPDGQTLDADLKPGQALFLPAGPHETTNIGNTDVNLLVFELKE
ncbi:MAG TPA: cupin domain-containing protein [Anaerolineae bacterium]|nr:cupin domain-containing protein [Anaerolineae bacterium]